MKKAVLSLVLITFCIFQTFSQKATFREVQCDSKEITFYNEVDFMYNPRTYDRIPKREGVNSYEDLTEKEIKMLRKTAKKSRSCFVVCDFDYQTPKALKSFDQAEEDEKKNYFYFYSGRRTVPIE
ncbi:hypothetical protein [Brumimicrobium mesophilum]|uniref:hypothetical protein n=1 Tax=Brumimicrobium mesophilum TaxID=392717 RepID=UPI000D13F8B4|nr:hypothetical protein [Brumimicrobium mesophilum]